MNKIGTLESVWRYPVKSMRGESVNVLPARDLERDYILLCQSEPLTDDVSVDCDD